MAGTVGRPERSRTPPRPAEAGGRARTVPQADGPRVVVFQRVLPHYRVGVFQRIAGSPAYRYTFCFGRRQENSFLKTVGGRLPFRGFYREIVPLCNAGNEASAMLFQPAEIHAAVDAACDVLIFSADLHIVSYPLAAMLAKLSGKRVIFWGHLLSRRSKRWGWKWRMVRAWLRMADAVLLYGEREYEELVHAGFPREKLFVTHNALDTRESRRLRGELTPAALDAFRAEKGWEGRRLLLFVGRVREAKRLDLLVEAMPQILKRVPEALAVLVGDGPGVPALARRVEELGVQDSVALVGPVFEERELARLFLCSDLAVCPSALGLLANHAFAYGVPVVTSDETWAHGPEIAMVRPGQTGELFRRGDAADLARCIIELLTNPDGLARMRANCLDLIERQYNETEFAAAFDRAVRYTLRGGEAGSTK